MLRPMPKRTRNKRARAGAAGGRQRTAPRAAATGAPIDPDELVFGTADQLREMAGALQRNDRQRAARAVTASTRRVNAFRESHPDAEPTVLRGRPVCAATAAVADQAPRARREGPRVRVATDGPGAAELWIDDYLEAPNWFGDGISSRDVREALDAVGSRDVIVHLNSGGGDYFEGVAIYQAFRQHPGDVYMSVGALAASAASVVAMAGDTVGIGDGAFIMIHEASGFAYGQADEMLAMADLLDSIGAEIAGFYARKTGTPADDWRTSMKAETWYGPTAAIDAGLADEHLDPPDADPDAIDDGDDTEDMTDDEADQLAAVFPTLGRPAVRTTPAPDPAPEPTSADWDSVLFPDDDTLDLEDMLL